VKDKVDSAEEIEMALWFHDAVYEPFSATNEEDSAEWAADWLQERGAELPLIARITDHILDTKSHDTPENLDGQFMLDIDLSILGTAPEIYDVFETNIRREYRRVPGFIFRKKRKAILEGFSTRERIYATEYFHEKLEGQARENLARAISQL
jgi:predicted metal-dependent HD superfamily phosphohydrolase